MKKKVVVFNIVLTVGLTLSACGSQQAQYVLTATYGIESSYTPTVSHTVEPSSTLQATATMPPVTATTPLVTQEPVSFPLSERGPYWTGYREYMLVDDDRDGREIKLTIWYPALMQPNAEGKVTSRDAVPDMSGAPYPLILTEPNSGNYLFQSHLASHGFVMAIVRFPDDYDNWDFGVIDHPRDILFALDQIASNFPEGLEGVIDSDHVGVAGYSWGGFYSLAVSGVRIDPEFYLARCAEAPSLEPPLNSIWLNYYCNLSSRWDEFAAHAGDTITTSDDGLWQPITDNRIRVVAPLAPDGAWLYGERGLAAVDRPTLIIVGTKDTISSYTMESVYIFEHLGTPDRYMISYIGEDHMMVFSPEPAARMKHFVTAFFGYYLQGNNDYAEYFSEDFIAQFDDLAWGTYSDE
jgi:predicted dienelactone hydrolase